MTGGIDEVQFVHLPVLGFVRNAHSLCLDGDATLPFQLHFVQILLARLPLADNLRQLKNAVGQGGFAVVDVGDNAKIADIFLVGHGHVLGNWMGWRKIFRVEPQSISKIRAEVYFCKP